MLRDGLYSKRVAQPHQCSKIMIRLFCRKSFIFPALLALCLLHAGTCQRDAHRLHVKSPRHQKSIPASETQNIVLEVPCDGQEDTWSPFDDGRLLGGSNDDDSDGDTKDGYIGPGRDEKRQAATEPPSLPILLMLLITVSKSKRLEAMAIASLGVLLISS